MNPYTWMRGHVRSGQGIIAPLYDPTSHDTHMSLIRRKVVMHPNFTLENVVAALLPEDVLDETISDQVDGELVTQPLTKYLYYRKGVVPIIMPGRRSAISFSGMLEEAGYQGVFAVTIPMVIHRIEDVNAELNKAMKRVRLADTTGISPALYIDIRVPNQDSKEATERLLSEKLEAILDQLGDSRITIMVTYPVRAGQFDNIYHHPNTLRLVGLEIGKPVREHTIRSNDGMTPCIPSIFHENLISYGQEIGFSNQLNVNIDKLKSLTGFTGA